MEIIHISAECYPMAKVGGLADVVGALPKYQNKLGHIAKVIMPMYKTPFLKEQQWSIVHKATIYVGNQMHDYTIIKEKDNTLGFDLYLVDIYGVLDRDKVYGYDDDHYRFIAFQIAALHWICAWNHKPDVIHCHDYHAGLVPFMMKFCDYYNQLHNIKSVVTIHNGQYQGWMSKSLKFLIPKFDEWKIGMLEWADAINPLASAVKCAWRVNAVSKGYMYELSHQANGLEKLFEYEKGKCTGIVNGIDNEVWDPATDKYLRNYYNVKTLKEGKLANKTLMCDLFGLDVNKPLIAFIGRLVEEKAADVLPDSIAHFIEANNNNVNCVVLGSGDKTIEHRLNELKYLFPDNFDCYIGYNEALSHELYAGADFLLMPSRVEPCGLNQLYAMRYGTIPIVRNTGGLMDTIVDIDEPNGYGIKHNVASVHDINFAVMRAMNLYYDEVVTFDKVRKKIMELNFGWEQSAQTYIDLYNS
jgi:starch synthase